MITVHFDGLNEPVNPGGVACWGYVIEHGSGKIVANGVVGSGMDGDYTTNNIAEYTALIKALEFVRDSFGTGIPVRVYGDSMLVINQLRGSFRVKSPVIAPLWERAGSLASSFGDITFTWVPREQNAEADAQTNIAYAGYVKENMPRFISHYKKYLNTVKQRSLLGQVSFDGRGEGEGYGRR